MALFLVLWGKGGGRGPGCSEGDISQRQDAQSIATKLGSVVDDGLGDDIKISYLLRPEVEK